MSDRLEDELNLQPQPLTIDTIIIQLTTYLKRSMGGRQVGGGESSPKEAKQALQSYIDSKIIEARKEIYFRLTKHLDVYDWTADEKDSILQAVFETIEGLDKALNHRKER